MPGAGCCSSGVIAIVSFLPEILPCRTACAIGEFRTKRICLLPTIGVTLNSTCAGEAANGFTSACAEPLPAIDFLQTAVLAIRSSSDALQMSRPLVETFSVLGSVIVILAAVVLLSRLLVTESLSFSDFGLDFVPAFVGDTLAVASMDGSGRLGIRDAGHTESERRRTGSDEGLTQEGVSSEMDDAGLRAGASGPHRAADL